MTPRDKMIHVTDAAHAAVRRHCKTKGVRVKDWASRNLLDAVARGRDGIEIVPSAIPQEPVETTDHDAVPWARPPFWEGH